jgi:hypothetical protein
VRHAPSTRVSLFLVVDTRVLVARLSFHCKGGACNRGASRISLQRETRLDSASCIDPKVRHSPNRRVSFQLASSSTV